MLVKIQICGEEEDIIPKLEKFSEEDKAWFVDTKWKKGKNCLKMPLEDVVRLLQALDKIEKIYFEVR